MLELHHFKYLKREEKSLAHSPARYISGATVAYAAIFG